MASSISWRGLEIPHAWVLLASLAGITIGYTAATDPVVHSMDQVLYPAVWIAASGLALWLVPDYHWRSLGIATLGIGVGYTLVLLWTANLLQSPAGPEGLSLHLGIPGWGPAVVLTSGFFTLTLVPFLLFGYATLGVLAGLAIRQSWQAAAPGLVGLLACVSCTAPLLAAVAGSLGAGSIAASLTQAEYPVATAFFLISVVALTAILRRGAPSCDVSLR